TLERHPEDRYQSAYDLADELESFLRDGKLHSGPVRIARYLDMLALAAGRARRPELISEAEARPATADELDFDSQVLDGFAHSEGAFGRMQAPLWEGVERIAADIAAALHLELAELRALRAPVPVRPSGMMPVRGDAPLLPGEAADAGTAGETEERVTNPVRRVTDEFAAPSDDGDDLATTMQTPRPELQPKPR